jgi:hypothetical protein
LLQIFTSRARLVPLFEHVPTRQYPPAPVLR